MRSKNVTPSTAFRVKIIFSLSSEFIKSETTGLVGQINLASVDRIYSSCVTHLAKESHSEVCAQQPLSCVHDLRHFAVATVQRVIQVSQFLLRLTMRLN